MLWHPIIVHFPLALLAFALAVDLAALVRGHPGWHRFAYAAWAAGTVAAALAVSRLLEVADETALRGMYRVIPDPGACTRWEIVHGGTPIEVHNIFAANDPESPAATWERAGLHETGPRPTVALLNLRGDRTDRSLQFAEAIEARIRADHYLVVGDARGRVLRRFRRKVPEGRLSILGKATPARVFDRLAEIAGAGVRVGGSGNIGGIGHEILRFVEKWGGSSC